MEEMNSTTKSSVNELSVLFCGITQPIVVLLLLTTFLFDNDARINHPSLVNKTNWNRGFGALLVVYIFYLYTVLAITSRHYFNTAVGVVYLTILSWVLLNAADFEYALHKSVWMAMYANVVIVESLLWVFCVYLGRQQK